MATQQQIQQNVNDVNYAWWRFQRAPSVDLPNFRNAFWNIVNRLPVKRSF